MERRTVSLTKQARAALLEVVKRDPKPYLRERAAAIVKVADGEVAAQVAVWGLLTRHKPDTVYGWLDRFAAQGIAGLRIAAGRGRKPTLFPPGERGPQGAAAPRAAGAAGE
jgi:hypothetical protein